jgi:glycosyltransferase involved in cell wall biosynthesis
LHFYLTVPFVLSWSLFDALACESTVVASDTAPVRELVRHEDNGLLVNFFDEEGFLDVARRVLRDPAAFRPLGRRGREDVQEHYSYEVCLPRLAALLHRVAEGPAAGSSAGW